MSLMIFYFYYAITVSNQARHISKEKPHALATKEKIGPKSVCSPSLGALIGHFGIIFGLFFKASLGAHLFIWKLIFIWMWMKANFHMKRWAPGLALKKRPNVIRKWPISFNCFSHFVLSVTKVRVHLLKMEIFCTTECSLCKTLTKINIWSYKYVSHN